MLKENEAFFVALTLVGVLVLLYSLVLHPMLGITIDSRGITRQGMMNYSAGNAGYKSVHSTAGLVAGDLYAGGSSEDQNVGSDMGVINNFGNTPVSTPVSGFSIGGYEPPVYWPAGNAYEIDRYSQASIADEGHDMNPVAVMPAAANAAVAQGFGGSYVSSKIYGGSDGFKSNKQHHAGFRNINPMLRALQGN